MGEHVHNVTRTLHTPERWSTRTVGVYVHADIDMLFLLVTSLHVITGRKEPGCRQFDMIKVAGKENEYIFYEVSVFGLATVATHSSSRNCSNAPRVYPPRHADAQCSLEPDRKVCVARVMLTCAILGSCVLLYAYCVLCVCTCVLLFRYDNQEAVVFHKAQDHFKDWMVSLEMHTAYAPT